MQGLALMSLLWAISWTAVALADLFSGAGLILILFGVVVFGLGECFHPAQTALVAERPHSRTWRPTRTSWSPPPACSKATPRSSAGAVPARDARSSAAPSLPTTTPAWRGWLPPDMLAWLHSPRPGAVTAMP